jgi:hypothetical protein
MSASASRGPEYWRNRADEVYAKACEMHDPDAKRIMLQIAKMYAAMAIRVEFWEAAARAQPPLASTW